MQSERLIVELQKCGVSLFDDCAPLPGWTQWIEPVSWWRSLFSRLGSWVYRRIVLVVIATRDRIPIEKLRHLPHTRILLLHSKWINDEDLRHVGQLSRLAYLDIHDAHITDEGLVYLSGLRCLKMLSLTNCQSLRGYGLRHFAECESLNSLSLRDSMIDDSACTSIRLLSQVSELAIAGTQVSDDGIAALATNSGLRTLNLNETLVTDVGIGHISDLCRMQNLGLERTNITDGAGRHLASLARLSDLNLKGTRITDAILQWLSRLTSLSSLDLTGTGITDQGLRFLAILPKLKYLGLSGTKVTPGAIQEFRRMLPEIRIL